MGPLFSLHSRSSRAIQYTATPHQYPQPRPPARAPLSETATALPASATASRATTALTRTLKPRRRPALASPRTRRASRRARARPRRAARTRRRTRPVARAGEVQVHDQLCLRRRLQVHQLPFEEGAVSRPAYIHCAASRPSSRNSLPFEPTLMLPALVPTFALVPVPLAFSTL